MTTLMPAGTRAWEVMLLCTLSYYNNKENIMTMECWGIEQSENNNMSFIFVSVYLCLYVCIINLIHIVPIIQTYKSLELIDQKRKLWTETDSTCNMNK